MGSTRPGGERLKRTPVRFYLLAFAAGVLSTLGGYAATILLLEQLAPQYLPPPQITNQLHLDEKLRFLRENPHFEPVMLGFGSSGVLRSVDFAPFQRPSGPPFRFLNLGIPGASIKDTRANSRFFLSKFAGTGAVLTMLVPPDFESCSEPAKPFDHEDAWAFATGRVSSLWFYLKYFSIFDFAVDMTRIAEERKMTARGERRLYYDPFGSGPVEMEPGKTWNTYTPRSLDPACFAELSAWSRELQAAGIALYVVIFPVSPEWIEGTPGARDYVASFERRIRSALREPGVRIIEGRALFDGAPDSHVDAYHLQWSAARRFSQKLSAAIAPELAVAFPQKAAIDNWVSP
jgi:hypothetical protein